MDIESLITKDTADCAIVDTVGNPTDISITLYGVDSQQYREAMHKKLKGLTKNSGTKEIFDAEVQFLAELTKSWTGVRMEGKEIGFSAENAEMIYRKSSIVRSQVSAFVHRTANFLPNA